MKVCRTGFTFIELVISMALLAIGIFPVLELFSSALSTVVATRTNVTAVNFANEALEMVKNMNLSVDQWIEMKQYDYPLPGEEDVIINGQSWNFSVVVTEPARPLPLEIRVFQSDSSEPVLKLHTLLEDLY